MLLAPAAVNVTVWPLAFKLALIAMPVNALVSVSVRLIAPVVESALLTVTVVPVKLSVPKLELAEVEMLPAPLTVRLLILVKLPRDKPVVPLLRVTLLTALVAVEPVTVTLDTPLVPVRLTVEVLPAVALANV